jgi:hypothetical protein
MAQFPRGGPDRACWGQREELKPRRGSGFLPGRSVNQRVAPLSCQREGEPDSGVLSDPQDTSPSRSCSLFSSAESAQLLARPAENAGICRIRDTSGALSSGYANSAGGRSRSLVRPSVENLSLRLSAPTIEPKRYLYIWDRVVAQFGRNWQVKRAFCVDGRILFGLNESQSLLAANCMKPRVLWARTTSSTRTAARSWGRLKSGQGCQNACQTARF